MNSANERICMHACLVAQRGSYIEQTVHNCPDCQCLKSAINSDSAFLASGHQGMRKNSYRVCWSLYGFNVFSGGGHPHYVVTGNFHDYYLSKENN